MTDQHTDTVQSIDDELSRLGSDQRRIADRECWEACLNYALDKRLELEPAS